MNSEILRNNIIGHNFKVVFSMAFGMFISLILIVIPRSSATVGCAVATFDFWKMGLDILKDKIRKLLVILRLNLMIQSLKKKYELLKFITKYKKINSQVELATFNLENYNQLKIGKNVVLNDASLDTNWCITIGDNVFFGWNVKILTGSYDFKQTGFNLWSRLLPRNYFVIAGRIK